MKSAHCCLTRSEEPDLGAWAQRPYGRELDVDLKSLTKRAGTQHARDASSPSAASIARLQEALAVRVTTYLEQPGKVWVT